MKSNVLAASVAFVVALLPSAGLRADNEAAIRKDVSWCLGSGANQNIGEQASAMGRNYCAAIWQGKTLPAVKPAIGTKRQNEWSRDAAALACDGSGRSQTLAVELVAACQCHNESRARRILASRPTVISELRRLGGCEKTERKKKGA
ncbi:MAG: hypothetical protein NTV97_06500 [Alphaproteobacteria bacterium]|nr:hypothetical protein [Alphaproteobacteria bacterium]